MTSAVSTPADGTGEWAAEQLPAAASDAALLRAVPDLLGLLEDGLPFLFLSNIKKV